MKLIDFVEEASHRLVAPLTGFPGIKLTNSTPKANLLDSGLQFRTLTALFNRFNPDIVFSLMDLTVEAEAIGLPILFPPDGPPSVKEHPIRSIEDLKRCEAPDPKFDGRMAVFIEVINRLSKALSVPTCAYVIGPFTLAGELTGAQQASLYTIKNPSFLESLLKFSTEVITNYAQALVQAGTDFVCILEPTAGLLSPKSFEVFSGRWVKKIMAKLDKPTILHICGNTNHLIEAMQKTGAQGLSLDSWIDFQAIAPRLKEDIVLIGNIGVVEVMLSQNSQAIYAKTKQLVKAMERRNNFILSTACDLPAETPLKNIEAFMRAGREFGGKNG